jgi:hypothetical protein
MIEIKQTLLDRNIIKANSSAKKNPQSSGLSALLYDYEDRALQALVVAVHAVDAHVRRNAREE